MTRYVSLLRGINVGGRIVKMADLKDCYEQAGMENITTLLQSGNVVFDSQLGLKAAQAQLENAVETRFHYPAKILVLPQVALQSLIDAYPFHSSDDNYQNYIIFMWPGLATDLAAMATGLDPETESVAAGNDVVYWRVRKGLTLKSTFAQNLTKTPFKNAHTNRNLNTVRKLAALT